MNKYASIFLSFFLVGCATSPYSINSSTREQMIQEMILPTAQISRTKEVTEETDLSEIWFGSGVSVISRPFKNGYETFVITNAHVVKPMLKAEIQKKIAELKEGEELTFESKEADLFNPIYIKYFRATGWDTETEQVEGKVVSFHEAIDIALVRFTSDHPFPTVNVPQGEIEYKVFETIYSVGGGQNNNPFPSGGIISLLVRNKTTIDLEEGVEGITTSDKLLLSSEVSEGHSGGPTFQYSSECECFEWIAVNQGVAIRGFRVHGAPDHVGVYIPLYHLHWAIPFHEVRRALEGTSFEDLLDK